MVTFRMGLNLSASGWSTMLWGTHPWETLVGSQTGLVWYDVFQIKNSKMIMLGNHVIVDVFLRKLVPLKFSVECFLSRVLIVCTRQVVVYFGAMPFVVAILLLIWERKNDPLSVIFSVGRSECCVIKSHLTLTVFTGVGLDTGCGNAYLEKTLIALMRFSQPPFGTKFGAKSARLSFSYPMFHSGTPIGSVLNFEWSIRLSSMRLSSCCNHLLETLATDHHLFLLHFHCINLETPNVYLQTLYWKEQRGEQYYK